MSKLNLASIYIIRMEIEEYEHIQSDIEHHIATNTSIGKIVCYYKI